MTLLELTHRTIQTHKLLPEAERLIVGVSGGADSLALLHILYRLRGELRVELHVATFDHGLRGQAGADDVRFVVEMCQRWDIPVTAGAQQVKPEGSGIESAARTARYAFLASVARESGAHIVAVAHHAGDQAETVLMRLIRGAGLRGLSGMAYRAPMPGHPDLTLIRPLLDARREDIETYCQQNDLTPRQDLTNRDTRLLRNRIRLQTLPALRQLNPNIDRVLLQLAAQSALEYDFLRAELEARIAGKVTQQAGRVMVDRTTFLGLHPALQRQFVADAVQHLGGRDAGYEHIVTAVELATSGQTGQMALMPGGIRLRLDYDTVVIEQAGADVEFDGPLLPAGTQLEVAVPGITLLPGIGWRLELSETPFAAHIAQAQLAFTPGQKITLRTRQPGDRFAPLGLKGHTQSIKKWMVDHKVPQAIRNQIPLLIVDDQIAAFIIGSRWVHSEQFKASEGSQKVIHAAFRAETEI